MTQQKSPSVNVPQTRTELENMMARRGELKLQLRDIESRRQTLAAQIGTTPSEARAPILGRLQTLDARITQVEREILQMDAAISTAMSNPKVMQGEATEPGEPAPPSPPAAPAFEHVIGVPPGQSNFGPDGRKVVVGGMLAVSLAFFAGWMAFRMAMRRLRREGVGATGDPAHMAKLQQSVDAIALEVERISENQRYVTKMLNQGAAEPVQSRAGEKEALSRGEQRSR